VTAKKYLKRTSHMQWTMLHMQNTSTEQQYMRRVTTTYLCPKHFLQAIFHDYHKVLNTNKNNKQQNIIAHYSQCTKIQKVISSEMAKSTVHLLPSLCCKDMDYSKMLGVQLTSITWTTARQTVAYLRENHGAMAPPLARR